MKKVKKNFGTILKVKKFAFNLLKYAPFKSHKWKLYVIKNYHLNLLNDLAFTSFKNAEGIQSSKFAKISSYIKKNAY